MMKLKVKFQALPSRQPGRETFDTPIFQFAVTGCRSLILGRMESNGL